jgi:uncharacterized protein YjiS (DUF1127 family)
LYTYDEAELLRRARVRDAAALQPWRDESALRLAIAEARAAKLRQLWAGLIRVVRGPFTAFAAWRHRRMAIAELEALDPRILADIGILRADIPAIAAGRLRRDPMPVPLVLPRTIDAQNDNRDKIAA